MNLVKFAVLILAFTLFGPSLSKAAVNVRVDLAAQRMTVTTDDGTVQEWAISSGRGTYRTPTGQYRAQWLDRNHRSSRYHNAPMPYSVFFRGNYAIHGTNDVRNLGRPASHGCVRLHPANAAKLFALVQRNGLKQTVITITGQPAQKIAKHHRAKTQVKLKSAKSFAAKTAPATAVPVKTVPASTAGDLPLRGPAT